jgi:para-aminobenzoate synthetase / 4-amino-4-deoxychorismate lyase
MLVRGGRVHAAARHLERLQHSVAALYGARLPRDLATRIRTQAAPLRGEHRLRVDIIAGQQPAVSTQPVAHAYRRPVTLEPLIVPGGLGPHKWRDRRLLDTRPIEPAPLLLDADHTVLEAAWGNFWLLEDERLITPPADGRILPGVTRALLLERAASLGLHVLEEPISLERARAAQITFATSAIRLAVPAAISGSSAPPAAPVHRIRALLS